MNTPLQQQLIQAKQLFDQGQVPQAEQQLRTLLKSNPSLPPALGLLGAIALQKNQPKEALQHLKKAVAGSKSTAGFRIYLADAQARLGQYRDAIQSLQKAHKIEPGNPLILHRLGNSYVQSGQYDAALKTYQQALAVSASPGTHTQMAQLHIKLEQWDAAKAELQNALKIDPDFIDAHYQLGNLHALQGDASNASSHYARTLSTNPEHVPALRQYAYLLGIQRNLDRSLPMFEKALALAPNDILTLLKLGSTYLAAGRLESALEAFGKAVALQPDSAEGRKAQVQQAMILEQMNRLEEAEHIIRSVEKFPYDGPTLPLVKAKLLIRRNNTTEAQQVLETTLDSAPENGERDYILLYAELAELLEKAGKYDQAFQTIEKAHRISAAHPRARLHKKETFLNQINACREWFTPGTVKDWQETKKLSRSTPAPVFLVGFPRSGTTLLERMLGAHPNIMTSNEEVFLADTICHIPELVSEPCQYPQVLASLDETQCIKLREYYWQRVHAICDTAGKIFIDKQPFNLVHLGFIQRIFPESRVLFLLRDPRDVILSCLKQTFNFSPATVNMFTLKDTTHLYCLLMELASHYGDILPQPRHTLRYESLTESPKDCLKRVLEFINLPWDKTVLEYFNMQSDRAVTTPSHEGVNQPVYKTAIGKWEPYASHFAPLMDTLQPLLNRFGYDEN